MLNLVRENILLVKNKKLKNVKTIKSSKHFPSSTREWKNSIYLYNKYNLNTVPNSATSSIKIIKGYFSLFNKNIENKIRIQRLKNKSRLSSKNKIWISNGEFKHTNNKVIVNLYLYNREKKNYLISINKYKKRLFRRLKKVNFFITKRLNYGINKGLGVIKKKLKFKFNRRINNKKIFLIKKYSFLQAYNSKIYNSEINNYINLYVENFLEKYVETTKKKLLMYWYYRQLIYINNSKYNYTFLQYLKEQLYKIYNKEIEFNLINLKQFYLNSDILSESIANKITKKRRKIRYYFKSLKKKIAIRKKKPMLHKYVICKKKENKKNLSKSAKLLQLTIIKNLKYRHISGYRIEAKGRLTKRNTASRSIKRVYYQGNLYNIDSSIKGLSTVLLKGNLNSNVQYTALGSQGGIGSFGIKGWVSGN